MEVRKLMFVKVMENSPNTINDFKHLLDDTTLKEIINEYPLTKIYLKD